MSRFRTIMGTGGIGTGVIYLLEGDHDLGRNETRMGRLQDKQDFCKLHIILHYTSRLLKDLKVGVRVLPVGAVGNDEQGKVLRRLMTRAGMNTKHMATLDRVRTLRSVCYQYPDKSGGNITESNSASARVSAAMIRKAAGDLPERGIVLAAPEVPLAARQELLKRGRQCGALNVASFVSEEIARARERGLIRCTDILCLNIDEAATLGGVSQNAETLKIIAACARRARKENPAIRLLVTNGGAGSYGVTEEGEMYMPALKVKVCNTAGAGDASVAGVLVGLAMGLPFTAARGASCMKLARLIGAMSVMSDDTIHFGINLRSLRAFAKKHKQGRMI